MKRFLFSTIALLALTVGAEAACPGNNCFWIGGTGTLDLATDTLHWSGSSGGTTCACEPGTTDTITFDGSSGGGTVTVNIAGGTWTAANLTLTAFTGTLDFAANNNNFTTTFNVDDNGTTATFNMGNGTWTLSGSSSFFRVASGATFNSNGSTLTYTGTGAAGTLRRLFGNGKTFNAVNVAANANSNFTFSNNVTITTLTIGAPNRLDFSGSTVTVTNAATFTGSSSAQIALVAGAGQGNRGTYSSANNMACNWCGITNIIFSGGGTFTAPNSFDLGGNSNIAITAPSPGGGRSIGL